MRLGKAGAHRALRLQRFRGRQGWTQHQKVARIERPQLEPGIVKHALKISGKRGLIVGIQSQDAATVDVHTGETCHEVHGGRHPGHRRFR